MAHRRAYKSFPWSFSVSSFLCVCLTPTIATDLDFFQFSLSWNFLSGIHVFWVHAQTKGTYFRSVPKAQGFWSKYRAPQTSSSMPKTFCLCVQIKVYQIDYCAGLIWTHTMKQSLPFIWEIGSTSKLLNFFLKKNLPLKTFSWNLASSTWNPLLWVLYSRWKIHIFWLFFSVMSIHIFEECYHIPSVNLL